jgi:hypothetical protein
LGAENVCYDELRRAGDTLVNVALGGEVDDGGEVVGGEKAFDGGGVANVAFYECVARVAFDVR